MILEIIQSETKGIKTLFDDIERITFEPLVTKEDKQINSIIALQFVDYSLIDPEGYYHVVIITIFQKEKYHTIVTNATTYLMNNTGRTLKQIN
jgi:hypothetical protein